jgi:hypothetical protein
MAGLAILAASGASGEFKSELTNGELKVIFPVGLVDVSLFTDLLQYILPAGLTYHIIRKNELTLPSDYSTTELSYGNKLIAEWIPDVTWDVETGRTTGLANLYDVAAQPPVFANFIEQTSNKLNDKGEEVAVIEYAHNIGLLDSSIIPALTTPMDIPSKKAELLEKSNESDITTITDKLE